MTPLLSLLLAGLPNGLWRVDRFDDLDRRLVESFGHSVTIVDLSSTATKAELLQALADTLGFPQWFGHNWDALHDSLAEMAGDRTLSDLTVLDVSTGGGDADALATLVEIAGEIAADAGPCFLLAGPGPASVPPLSHPIERRPAD